MKKFIPYKKLSKKKRRESDLKQRRTWGTFKPITRNTENPKAYHREKIKRWKPEEE